jgi:hypothetical protein
MMITFFLLGAASLLELGASPLAEPGHSHDWAQLPNQAEGETALHDRNWTGTYEQDGQTYRLALMRSDLIDGGAPVVMDVIIAADCANSRLGLMEAYFFESPVGNQLRIPIDYVEMDLAADPLGEDDAAILDAACN